MGYIIKDNPLWDISDDIIIYLTDSQVDMIKLTLKEYVEKNKKVKTHKQQDRYLYNEDGEQEFEDWKIKPESEGTKEAEEKIVKDILPLAGDANTIAKTDANYSQEALNNFKTSAHNFTYKIKINWVRTGLIDEAQYNSLIESIVLSSPAAHNDWVYSLSGEKDSKQGRKRITLDIHDRRIDDPNFALVVRGGVTVGDPENPQDRKKMTVLGETELQDGTAFGRLLDTYGEKNPMEFGHQIPDHGKYPKVYINRGEDRYNGEDWDDGTYGLGQGTIEAYKEIVSHTTISADRGMIIEDGVGDSTDRVIEKTVENEENCFKPTGAPTHETNGFALSIHHDGAKIQGHTYMTDEDKKNEYYLVNNTIKQPEGGEYVPTSDPIIEGCWVCTNNENENDYKHYCTNRDNKEEIVIDFWPGYLYHNVQKDLVIKEGRVYITTDKRYWYEKANKRFVEIRVLQNELGNEELQNSYYYINTEDGRKVQLGYRKVEGKEVPIKEEIEEVANCTAIEENDEIVGFKVEVAERIIPQTFTLYKIKDGFTNDGTYTDVLQGNEVLKKNDYLYWNGIKFIIVPTKTKDDLPKLNKTYGSLTIGTRANGEQDNDTIGRNSLEVGSENEAVRNNSAAIGTGNVTAQDSQVLVGKYADGANDAIPEANYTEEEEETSQVPRFAVGIGDSSESKNGFAVSEKGDAYVAGHEQVDGTSDLRKKTTIGADVDDHEIALEVLKHAQFDQNVMIKREPNSNEKSLDVKGESQFDDTVTIGQAGENGTFWDNFEDGKSNFIGLSVHGEIENERIPEDLYTATQIGNELVLNEFADKFWVNSSLSSNSATFRGSYNEDNYESAVGNYANQSTNVLKESWLKQKIPNWLKNNVVIYPIETPIETSAQNNTKSAIESSLTNADKNKLYHLTGEPGSGYYYYRGKSNGQAIWEEFSQKPNNNDYCYIQATKTNTVLPYVLFDATYDKNGTKSEETWNEIDDFRKEIAVFRYKYVEDLYSDAGTWVFEFQLNNSGFTQAQWNAINSGLTKESLSDIQYKLNNIIGNFNSFKNIDFENFKNITNATFENLPNNYVTLGSTPATQEIIGSKIFSTHMSLGIRTDTWNWELANQNEQPKIQEQKTNGEDKRKKLQPAQEEAYLCNDNEAYGYYLLPEKDSSGWYTRLASWGKINSILGDWTDLELGQTVRGVIDGLDSELENFENVLNEKLKKYITIADDENVAGIKTFTNEAGIGIGLVENDNNEQVTQSYLKSNKNSLGTFLLPNYDVRNENMDSTLALKSEIPDLNQVLEKINNLQQGLSSLSIQNIINGLDIKTCTYKVDNEVISNTIKFYIFEESKLAFCCFDLFKDNTIIGTANAELIIPILSTGQIYYITDSTYINNNTANSTGGNGSTGPIYSNGNLDGKSSTLSWTQKVTRSNRRIFFFFDKIGS